MSGRGLLSSLGRRPFLSRASPRFVLAVPENADLLASWLPMMLTQELSRVFLRRVSTQPGFDGGITEEVFLPAKKTNLRL
ncbi:unnamed protein product [Urochloa humidicola]